MRVPKMSELVASDIRRQIVRGQLKEGDPLASETELMVQYSVSRPTLREALRVLEAESLVTVRRGPLGGPRVSMPDLSVPARYVALILQCQGTSLDDVYEARTIIEPPCCRMLANRQDPVVHKTLSDIIGEEEEALGDQELFNLAASRLHAAIVKLAGNQTLATLAGMIYSIIEAQNSATALAHVSSEEAAAGRKDALKTHRKLLSLIIKGDGQRAEELWRLHMDTARTIAFARIGQARSISDIFDRF